LKILQVYPSFKSVRGGVERYIEGLAKYLSRKGHLVKILTLEKKRFKFFGDSLTEEKSTHLSSLSTIYFEDFDVIHTHGFRVPYSSIIGLLRKVQRDRVIMTVHTIFPKRSTVDGILKGSYDLVIGNILLKTIDRFIAVNDYIQSRLRDLGVQKEKIALIPNSVDLERFENIPSPTHFLGKVGISSEEDIVLIVGRMDWQKGLEDAIKAFAEVHSDIKDTKLVIVGRDFGFKNHLQKLTKQYDVYSEVVFAGELSDETLYSAYASAKVFLMTSIYEGFPTVLLEAMASGLPVISTPIAGISEVIPNYHGVVWCDKKHLSKKLGEILSDETLRKNLSAEAKEIVKRDFDWDKNADRILNVYNSI